MGGSHSLFVDKAGRLHTCGSARLGSPVLGHALEPDADPDFLHKIGPPTPVPSMQRRIVCVASSYAHCLALSAEGEVYAWGSGDDGVLGHGDEISRAVPSRIETLSRIESIATGPRVCAAVNAEGRLFTWGADSFLDDADEELPNGLGYELDPTTTCQLTPKSVDALSQERVVGVALGSAFTLVVTDAGGAVFSFGYSKDGALGHGSI